MSMGRPSNASKNEHVEMDINDEYYDNHLFELVDDLEGISPTAGTTRHHNRHNSTMPHILEEMDGIESEYSDLYAE